MSVTCFTDVGDSECGGSSVLMDSISNCCLGPGYSYSLEAGTCAVCVGKRTASIASSIYK